MKTLLKPLLTLAVLTFTQTSFAQLSQASIDLMTKAAQQGDVIAQNNLGVIYEKGTGVPKNLVKAAHFYLLASEQGNPFAQANLVTMYLTGRGVDKNLPEAFAWAKKSANRGFAPARYLYSWHCEQNNPAMAQELNNAINWYVKMAERGDINIPIPQPHNCPSL